MREETRWFVVQTCAGREERALSLIKETVDADLFEEAFVPRYRTAKLVDGVWQPCTEVLFPGYLIVISGQPKQLRRELWRVPAFTRLLDNDGQFIPLNEQEVAWIDAFTQQEHRVIEVSEGYIEGDEIVITSGPLMNHTGWIKKINHRKKLAYLELEMFGHTVQAQVGLKIVRKRN